VASRCNPDLRSTRAQRDERLIGDIQQVWQANLRVYGMREMLQQLPWEGISGLLHRRASDAGRGTRKCLVHWTGSIGSSWPRAQISSGSPTSHMS
jgi:hypothetical protein